MNYLIAIVTTLDKTNITFILQLPFTINKIIMLIYIHTFFFYY